VHGDTTTSMMSALAAFYLKIPIGHVEAGLRTFDIASPFPEELNRQIISKISALHFAPTQISRQNLLDEKVPDSSIFVTGNTVIDALFSQLKKAREAKFSEDILNKMPFLIHSNNNVPKIILVTGHRRENFGKGFEDICNALSDIARKNQNVHIIYPVHLNPNVREPVIRILSGISNIYLIEPMPYLEFVKLMDISYLILTDSGGIQEEAPSLGKPVLVMRDTTERPEAIEAGTVRLVGASKLGIVKVVNHLIVNKVDYELMAKAHNPYGNGNSSSKISEILESRNFP